MKQRDLLKGRVKRVLKEQKDMGQVGESAVLCCAVQHFVKMLAIKMQQQSRKGHGLTPIELKKVVLASEELHFLHEKVSAIDENAAKYHMQGKKRIRTPAAAKKSSTKKARATRTGKEAKVFTETTAAKPAIVTVKKPGRQRTPSTGALRTKESVTQASSVTEAQAFVVEEDEDYDESDGDT